MGQGLWRCRRRERTAYYGNETIRKIAEMPAATPASVLEFVREQQRNAERRQREGLKLSGLITAAAGVGIIVFLWELQAGPVYMAGCIPLLIGLALLVMPTSSGLNLTKVESSGRSVRSYRCSLTVPLLGPLAVLDSLFSQIPERRLFDEYSRRADPEADRH